MQISFLSIPYILMIKSNQTNCSVLNLPSLPLKPGFGCPPMTRNTCPYYSSAEYLLLRVSEVVTFGTLSQAVTAFIPCVPTAVSSCQLSKSCYF